MTIAAKRLEAAFLKAYRSNALTAQGGCCKYCLEPMTRATVTADHRVPRSNGGRDHQHNIAAACRPCNSAKSSMSENAFRAALRATGSAPVPILMARFRRRTWTAVHASCGRIMQAVGGSYAGPRRAA